jgi:FMNH2-dependent dimethyl sulfone monooxygenase
MWMTTARERLIDDGETFKLVPFGFNISGGMSMTTVPGTPTADWDESLRLTLAAEAAGFDAVMPVDRWRGFGGETDFNGRQLETLTWAAGLAASTSEIAVFATCAMPTVHPVRLAKEVATIDRIAHGRFGLNVVAGWNVPEVAMFGMTQRDHAGRYDYAEEFLQVVRRLAVSDEPFDHHGPLLDIPSAISRPGPLQEPFVPVMCAGVSPRGRDFAARNADLSFIAVDTVQSAREMVAETKRNATENYGRELRIFAATHIVCADTEREARAFYDYYVHERGDWEACRNLMEMYAPNTGAGARFERSELAERTVAGWGARPVVGTPEQVAEAFVEMADAGLDGSTVSFVDFEQGLAQFTEQVMPLLVEAGLRRAPAVV